MSIESTPRPRLANATLRQHAALANEQAAHLIDESIAKLLRKAVMIMCAGVLLFGGFVIAFLFFNDDRSAVNRNGQEVTGTIISPNVPLAAGATTVLPPPANGARPVTPGPIVEVEYKQNGFTVRRLISVPAGSTYISGSTVRLSVDRDRPEQTSILGVAERGRATSMPVAGLLVSSILVFGMGLFDAQAALRCRKHLRDKAWRNLKWRGAVYGPGRGRVRAAGFLSDPEAERQYLMTNALGCWRQGVDLLAEPTELSVAGNPAGIVVVRHPATLRVVLLKPPRGERNRRKALSLLATGKA